MLYTLICLWQIKVFLGMGKLGIVFWLYELFWRRQAWHLVEHGRRAD
jgi:hypothetical protein